MKFATRSLTAFLVVTGMAGPAGAVSRPVAGPVQPLPDVAMAASLAAESTLETFTAGSAALVPVAAADVSAIPEATLDASEPAGGGIGKPVDDLNFLARAAEHGRREETAARDALFQLQDPQLKRVAEKLARDRNDANHRLARIAAGKMWPLPPRGQPDTPPAGTASPDFDARWVNDMITSQEQSLALYSAQAQAGDDPELRKYARETLPTIQAHLAELRRLQK